MSRFVERKPTQQAISEQHTKKWKTSPKQAAYATRQTVVRLISGTTREKRNLRQREPLKGIVTVSKSKTSPKQAAYVTRQTVVRLISGTTREKRNLRQPLKGIVTVSKRNLRQREPRKDIATVSKISMSRFVKRNPTQQAISEQHTKKWNLRQREPLKDIVTVSKRCENRDIEIREYVFAIRLPGVEITHCNFGKTHVEVWYVTEETDGDKFKEELQKEIGSNVEPYKLKLVKKAGLPTFKYTSPGQSTSLMRASGSIGAYVTLTDAMSGESNVHALVCGHGKEPGDLIYSEGNPGQIIGEVRVAKEGNTERRIVSNQRNYETKNSYDVGLVWMNEQHNYQHETTVAVNGERIQLARATAALGRGDMAEGQQVMLFNNEKKQGTVHFTNYNSLTQNKFGMIGIAQQPGEERQAVHGMRESGTLVVDLPPYQENGVKLVKAVGMLVGIEEFQQSPESISLAVPICTNLQQLIEDDYCDNKEIQFA